MGGDPRAGGAGFGLIAGFGWNVLSTPVLAVGDLKCKTYRREHGEKHAFNCYIETRYEFRSDR
jgi:hypothetical protein